MASLIPARCLVVSCSTPQSFPRAAADEHRGAHQQRAGAAQDPEVAEPDDHGT